MGRVLLAGLVVSVVVGGVVGASIGALVFGAAASKALAVRGRR